MLCDASPKKASSSAYNILHVLWAGFKVCPQFALPILSKGRAKFPSPWVWAGLSGSPLTNRMWWKWLCVASQIRTSKAWWLPSFSLSLDHCSGRSELHVMRTLKKLYGEVLWWGLRSPANSHACELSCWQIPSPNQASRGLQLSPMSWLTSWETMKQNHSAKLLLNYWPTGAVR